VAAGAHGRVAFIIGGLSGRGPRRSGFVIGVDAHPMFLSTGRALSLTLGLAPSGTELVAACRAVPGAAFALARAGADEDPVARADHPGRSRGWLAPRLE